MKLKTLLRAFPIMMLLGLLGVGAMVAPVGATVSTSTGPVGTTVTIQALAGVTGTSYSVRFVGTDTGSTTDLQVVPPTTFTAGAAITQSFAVPTVPQGSYRIDVVGLSNIVAAGTFAVTPSIIISPATAVVGTSVNVTGSGFAAATAINVYLGTNVTPVAQIAAGLNTNGSFSASFTVPQLPLSLIPYAIVATDADTPANSAQASLFITPRIISISALQGGVGDTVLVNADGFTSYGSVSIFFDSLSNTPLATVGADVNGAIPVTSIIIPAAPRGSHTIIVQDNTYTTYSANTTFTINVSKVAISPTTGQVGSVFSMSGNGFAAGVSIGFEFDGSPFANTSVITDATGSFIKTGLIVPTSPSGVHIVTARVSTDTAAFANANFTITSKIIISPTTGSTGTQVTISGTGFYPNAQMSLHYDGTLLSTAPSTLPVRADGTFNGIFTVPGAVEGNHTVFAADGQGNVASASFTSSLTATLTPVTTTTPGFVGQDLTAAGTGFKPNAAITVSFDGKNIASGTSDAFGVFTIAFKAPVVTKGSHPIIVTDGLTAKPFTFVMEGTPPQAPALTTPATGIKSKQPITFNWASVTDQSNPVTYKLEVSSDANFSTIVITHDGLTTNSYTMTDAEKLPTVSKKAPYYWRVTATDAAGNVGSPSTASTFVVGFAWADVPIWVWLVGGLFAWSSSAAWFTC